MIFAHFFSCHEGEIRLSGRDTFLGQKRSSSHFGLSLPRGHNICHPQQPSCDHSRPRKADCCGSSATKVSVFPHSLSSATDARKESCLEAVPKIDAEESIHAWIYAAVEVRHQMECCAHGFQVAVIQTVQEIKGCQHVLYKNRRPTNDKKNNNGHKHLDHLKRERFNVKSVSIWIFSNQ